MIDILIPSFRKDNINDVKNNIMKCSFGNEINLVFDSTTVGTYNAVRKMFNETSGEWIIHIPDDCIVTDGWIDRMMKMMEDSTIFVGGWKTYNEDEKHEPCKYYEKPFCAFICIRRDVANRIGGLIDERYTSFFGDPDLSLRAYEAGGRVEHLKTWDIFYNDKHDDLKRNNINAWYSKDEELFIKRWGKYK